MNEKEKNTFNENLKSSNKFKTFLILMTILWWGKCLHLK